MTHHLPSALVPDPNHRVSREMAAQCCLTPTARIIDRSAKVGAIRQCTVCQASYVNDRGIWRNLLTVDRRRMQKLHAVQLVDVLTGKGSHADR